MNWLADRSALAAAHGRSVAMARTWRESDAYRAVQAALGAIGADDGDAAVGVARDLLASADRVTALLAPLVEALRDDPLFQPSFRVHRDGLRIGALLLDHPTLSLGVSVMSADALAVLPPPRTIVMSGRRSVVRYHRAKGACLHRWLLRDGTCDARDTLILNDGDVLVHDGRDAASLIVASPRDVVTITATLRPTPGATVREFAIDTGREVRVATLDDAVSRTTMLLTLLRLTGRVDAGEAFDAASRHAEPHLRWGAMREWLALDVAGALPRLRSMAAGDPAPSVRDAARVTISQAEKALLCPA